MGKKQYDRLRLNSGQHRRILLVMLVMGLLVLVPAAVRLYQLMIQEYDYYSGLALRNQTRTTTVSAHRGDILDCNMNILATSVSVENVYLDPHELKQSKADISALSQALGQLLDKDPEWIAQQAVDFKQRYKQIGTRVDEETAGKIRQYINENDATACAELIAPYFDGTSVESLATSIESYKSIDAWVTDMAMKPSALDNLQAIMENSGELSRRVAFEELVLTETAHAVYEKIYA